MGVTMLFMSPVPGGGAVWSCCSATAGPCPAAPQEGTACLISAALWPRCGAHPADLLPVILVQNSCSIHTRLSLFSPHTKTAKTCWAHVFMLLCFEDKASMVLLCLDLLLQFPLPAPSRNSPGASLPLSPCGCPCSPMLVTIWFYFFPAFSSPPGRSVIPFLSPSPPFFLPRSGVLWAPFVR